MYTGEDYKFEAMDDEETKYGFEHNDIATDVETTFQVSGYPLHSVIKYVRLVTVKNNKFWIYTNDRLLYTMKFNEVPEDIDPNKFKNSEIISITADEKGTHCVIGTKSDKMTYDLFYLAPTGHTQKIISHEKDDHISCCTIYVPTEGNPDERIFEILYGTKTGSIYHGKFYMEKKGNFTTRSNVNEVSVINPKRKIYDICIFQTDSQLGIVAISDKNLHQFWGPLGSTIPDLFESANKNVALRDASIIEDMHFNDHRVSELRDSASSFNISLSTHEGMDETIKSIGWQSISCFYCIDFKYPLRDADSKITREMITEYSYPPAQGSRYGSVIDFPVS